MAFMLLSVFITHNTPSFIFCPRNGNFSHLTQHRGSKTPSKYVTNSPKMQEPKLDGA